MLLGPGGRRIAHGLSSRFAAKRRSAGLVGREAGTTFATPVLLASVPIGSASGLPASHSRRPRPTNPMSLPSAARPKPCCPWRRPAASLARGPSRQVAPGSAKPRMPSAYPLAPSRTAKRTALRVRERENASWRATSNPMFGCRGVGALGVSCAGATVTEAGRVWPRRVGARRHRLAKGATPVTSRPTSAWGRPMFAATPWCGHPQTSRPWVAATVPPTHGARPHGANPEPPPMASGRGRYPRPMPCTPGWSPP